MAKSPVANYSDINVHELLRERQQIAIIWSIEDVQELRLDLTADQAWEVLQACEHGHDCNFGITWLSLEMTADSLFPYPSDEPGE